MHSFSSRLIAWQRVHGRHDLPWQSADAYGVWLSEIMLQQTQVATVIPYYLNFIEAFPTIAALAAATEDQVLRYWSGLGYYARGRNLHRSARIIAERHHGKFPRRMEEILALPGIGRSTAAAICALAYHERRAILDGNVKRVVARFCGISGPPDEKIVEARLWEQAEKLLPKKHIAVYIQAQMDLGATLCTRSKPKCIACPVHSDCVAFQTGRVNDLPSPRVRKAAPERSATVLMLLHGNDILLEKRPGMGIWGGLWSLPQFDNEGAARQWYLQSGMHANNGERMETFTHAFTHFRLRITPLLIRLSRRPKRAMEPGSVWLSAKDALQAAIPAPVRSLLKRLNRGTG